MENLTENDLKKVSGGLSSYDYDSYEEIFGRKITWGQKNIPRPNDKQDTLDWGGEIWTPVNAHCGWHQQEVIWKNEKNEYLVPSDIEQNEM